MAAPPGEKGAPIESKAQLVEYLEAGCKPPKAWRIGTEHEKFGFRKSDLRRLPYDGPDGIGAILDGLCDFGWQPVKEGENTIALTDGACSISLEPGGQFELSGAPLATIHQTCDEVHSHLAQVKKVTEPLGVGMLGLGFDPLTPRAEVPWMPKGRYKIMREYMPKRGNLGLDMMLRTCTVQVNLDFASEADMVEKFRVSLALQPVATALFANSPFTEGKPNGFLSLRSHCWTDTDPDRTGDLPFVFEAGMGFERYVDYMLDVPMYFAYRDGTYLDLAGQSFRDFMDGKLEALPGERATLSDWADHLSTAFPEVRLKRFLEMRGADGGPWASLCALPALWVGLLYDAESQREAAAWIADWSEEERAKMRAEVPRLGLAAPFRDGAILDLARHMVALAEAGLKRRARQGVTVPDETEYLETLQETLDKGITLAEEKLALYEGKWQGSIEPLYRDFAY